MSNVKFFRSSDYGAPQLYGNAGYLIGVLDACLVNGYGTQNILTMTHSNLYAPDGWFGMRRITFQKHA